MFSNYCCKINNNREFLSKIYKAGWLSVNGFIIFFLIISVYSLICFHERGLFLLNFCNCAFQHHLLLRLIEKLNGDYRVLSSEGREDVYNCEANFCSVSHVGQLEIIFPA